MTFRTAMESKNFTIYQWDDPDYMLFEHNELGDECGGGLWFSGKELIDYDGVWMLPKEVYKLLIANGYSTEELGIDERDYESNSIS